jgi:hypothetical protein
MADIQAEIGAKEEQMLKAAAGQGWKLICMIYDNLPKFPKDMPEVIPKSPGKKQGKQSMKNLMGDGSKIENVEIDKNNIGDFKSTARKFGIDYSLKKITTPQANGTDKVQYAVYFKAKNANVMNMAMQEYAQKVAKRHRKPPLVDRMKAKIKDMVDKNRERSREKTKTRGQER